MTHQFSEIVRLIQRSRTNAQRMVNVEMINLYWEVGGYINQKITTSAWGDKTVKDLSVFIEKHHPELKGFGLRALYKMRQFHEIYSSFLFKILPSENSEMVVNQSDIIVPSVMAQFNDIRNTLLVKISWRHHLTLLEKGRKVEELYFYLRLCIRKAIQ